jgi:hypothetical protein
MYEDELWLQSMNELSQQLLAPPIQSSSSDCIVQQALTRQRVSESFEFEPFEIERLAQRTTDESL